MINIDLSKSRTNINANNVIKAPMKIIKIDIEKKLPNVTMPKFRKYKKKDGNNEIHNKDNDEIIRFLIFKFYNSKLSKVKIKYSIQL